MTADWPTPGRDPSWRDVFAVLGAEARDRAVRVGRMIRLIARPGPPRLSDDALLDLLGEAFEVMEPVPQRVIDAANAAYAAHQTRVGGDAHAHAVAAPDTTSAVPTYGRTDRAAEQSLGRSADGHSQPWAGAADLTDQDPT